MGYSYDEQLPSLLNCFLNPYQGQPEFTLRVSGVRDFSGNLPQNLPLTKDFAAPAAQDTSLPRYLSSEPSQRSSAVSSRHPIIISFDSPVDSILFKQHFQLQDTLGEPVSGKFDFQNIRRPAFILEQTYESEKEYEILLNLSEMNDIWQRPFQDTLLIIRFTSQSAGELGEIMGQVFAADLDWQQSIIEAIPIRGRDEYLQIVQKGQTYQIDNLPGGLYSLQAVLDINRNQAWDKGQTNPWMFSEPFLMRTDTVKVRKRWTTEGIDFNFQFRGPGE
jgi:hypothetical protein